MRQAAIRKWPVLNMRKMFGFMCMYLHFMTLSKVVHVLNSLAVTLFVISAKKWKINHS